MLVENTWHNFCVMLYFNNRVMTVVTLNCMFRHVYRFSAQDAMNFMEGYKCLKSFYFQRMGNKRSVNISLLY